MERWRRYVPQCEFLRYDFSALLVGKDIAAAEISFVYPRDGRDTRDHEGQSLGVRGGLADTDDRVLQPHRRRGIDSESRPLRRLAADGQNVSSCLAGSHPRRRSSTPGRF